MLKIYRRNGEKLRLNGAMNATITTVVGDQALRNLYMTDFAVKIQQHNGVVIFAPAYFDKWTKVGGVIIKACRSNGGVEIGVIYDKGECSVLRCELIGGEK